jgi:hypothetical protein
MVDDQGFEKRLRPSRVVACHVFLQQHVCRVGRH